MLRYLCTHYIYLNDIMIKIKKKLWKELEIFILMKKRKSW